MSSPPAPAPTDVRSLATIAKLVLRFRPQAGRAAGTFALVVARTGTELAVPLLVTAAIQAAEAHRGDATGAPPEFVRTLWILGGVMLARIALQYVSAVCAASLAQDLENELRSELFAKVTHLRFTYHDENRSGRTIARSLRDMEKARLFFREVAFGYLEAVLLLAGIVAATFLLHWSYGAVVGAVGLTAFLLTMRAGVRIARMDRTVSDQYDRVTTNLQENVAGARVVRAFGREPEESAKFGGSLGTFTGTWKGLSAYWTGVMPWIGNLYMCALPLVLLLGTWRIAHGASAAVEGARVVAALFYVRTMSGRLRPITRLVILGQEAVASAARVFEVLDRDEVIRCPAQPRRLPAAGGELEFQDVWFAFPGREPVLRGVSLRVPAGGSLGILGPTGSGKTSLVQLLPRYYDPTRGRVLLDGIDVQELDVRELRRAVGLVFQEPFLFSATVADNIAYGAPGATRERVVECARLAAAHEFVAGLPQGYDTVIGERGVSLSGGQRQRLTIARALAMDPRVLVFDDATASVDAVTEKELFQGIRAAARGRTTLVISQRVTSLRWCDRVAVLEDGAISAIGTHEELLRRSVLYREVQRHQELTGAHL